MIVSPWGNFTKPPYGGAVAATANADIQSANIVGYQNIDVKNGYQFFTVTFEDIADSTQVNVANILCKKSTGADWLRTGAPANACAGAIEVRKIDAEGSYGQRIKYYGKNAADSFGPGWYKETYAEANLISDENPLYLKPGEGLIVYTSKADGAAQFILSGAVKLTAMESTIKNGYQFGGNCTPVTLKLSDVLCQKANGADWLRTGAPANACAGAIELRKIDAEGSYGQRIKYYGKNASDTFGPGWYKETYAEANLIGGDNEITFAPGEGWILYTSKSDDAAKLVIPSAIK